MVWRTDSIKEYVEAGAEIPEGLRLSRAETRRLIYALRAERDVETRKLLAAYLDDVSDLLPVPFCEFSDGWLNKLEAHWGDLDVAFRGRGARWLARELPKLGYRVERGPVWTLHRNMV